MQNVLVYNNKTYYTGAEAIQVGAAYSGTNKIYGNYVDRYGVLQHDFAPNQNNGIQLGGGFQGHCYNNFIYTVPADNLTQAGIVGDPTNTTYVYNNIIVNAKQNGIYLGTKKAENGSLTVYVNNNTIVSPQGEAPIRLQQTAPAGTSTTIPIKVRAYNNLVTDNQTTYNDVVKTVSTDYLYGNNIQGTASNFFVDPVANNYHLKQAATAAIDKGNATVTNMYVTFDYDNQVRPYAGVVDIGADEYTGTVAREGAEEGDAFASLEFSVFPNPASKAFAISMPNSGLESYPVNILNLNGVVLKHIPDYTPGNDIAIGDLEPGMYIVDVLNGEKTERRKLNVVK